MAFSGFTVPRTTAIDLNTAYEGHMRFQGVPAAGGNDDMQLPAPKHMDDRG
jgi:hypothetical protein